MVLALRLVAVGSWKGLEEMVNVEDEVAEF